MLEALAASAALLAQTPSALANGRFPAAGQIALHPSDHTTIVVRATYGILATTDAGKTWGWICEGAVGYGGVEDPMMGITADGTFLAGIFKGLSVSRDGGCSWAFAGGDLQDRFVTDLSVERQDPSHAVLIVSNGIGPNQFKTQLWESSDNGAAWSQAGVDLADTFLALTVDAAPSDPSRVYVSGRHGPPDYPGTIERSKDRGKTWESLPVPGTNDTHLPYIGAIDPNNPDVLYVRIDGDPDDSLLVSKNGGETWETVFAKMSNLFGFALSPDGSTVYIGGGKEGLWRAPASTLAFEKVSDIVVRCLTAAEGVLYACSDEFDEKSKFTVGVSTTQGSTWVPLMHLASLCGPLACGAETPVATKCADTWGATQLTIGAEPCETTSPEPSPEPQPEPSPPGNDEGCGCRAAPTAGAGAALGGFLGALFAAWRRARRRRRSPRRL